MTQENCSSMLMANSEDLRGLPSAWCHRYFPLLPLSEAPFLNLHSFSLGGSCDVIPLA